MTDGVASHAPSKQQASFGELAADAARVPVPADVALESAAQKRGTRESC